MKNKETEEPKEKILRQEEFRVDCPRRIVVGDPSYFEEYSGERLKRLTANYAPTRFFEARVIIDEIKGRMMEDIVLLETKLSKKNCEVFRLQFAIGEFDMVVFNPDDGICEIYEIKHSKEVVPQQCRHLLDKQKCKDTEFRYGTIAGKYVIYRGATTSLVQAGVETPEDVTYLNVEEYLKTL